MAETAKTPASNFDIPGVQRLCEPEMDRASGGRYWLAKTTVAGYLELVGVYKPKPGQLLVWNPEVSVPGLQRALIRADKNAIKQAMFRDVLTGAILPPVTLYVEHKPDGSRLEWVLDGSQRTHVLFLDAIIAQNMGTILANYEWMQGELDKLKAQGKEALSFDELMAQPVFLQIWSDFVSPGHIVRLFLLLNAGQQKVSSRHLLEVLGRQLQGMFSQWGIPWITERTEKEGKLRSVKGTSRRFGYNFLLTGLVAYLKGDQHIKTDMILTERSDAGNFDLDLDDKIQAAGDETCRRDFTWVCIDLNRAITDQYDNDRAQNLIWYTETFFVPLMAAIGKARQRGYSVDEHQPALLEFIRKSRTGDPLVFGRSVSQDDDGDRKPDPRALFTILDNLTSNIGKYTRNIVYRAFLQFFRQGIEAKNYPIDWEIGKED